MKITKRQLKRIIRESWNEKLAASRRDQSAAHPEHPDNIEVNLVEAISHLIDKEMTVRTGDEFWYDSYENVEIVHNILDSVKDTYRGT